MRNNTGISIQLVPASVKRTIDGINQLERNFDKAIADVILNVGINIQREAKQNAPVDYGFLMASIYLDTRGYVDIERTGVSTAGQKSVRIPNAASKSRKDGFNAIIGSNLNYAKYIEQGRGPFRVDSPVLITRKGKRVGWRYIGLHPGYQAQPFLQPAYLKWKPKVKPAIRKAMIQEIKRSIFR